MQKQAILHKKCVVLTVIKFVKMGLLQELRIWFHRVICWIQPIREINKHGHLMRCPMHILDFILHLEAVILCKINVGKYSIIW
jgi:hypothetical protein